MKECNFKKRNNMHGYVERKIQKKAFKPIIKALKK
jgi:hypothetical protein